MWAYFAGHANEGVLGSLAGHSLRKANHKGFSFVCLVTESRRPGPQCQSKQFKNPTRGSGGRQKVAPQGGAVHLTLCQLGPGLHTEHEGKSW